MKLRAFGLALLALATAAGAQQTVTQVRASPATFTAGTTAPLQGDTHGALHVVTDATSTVTATPSVTGNGTAATAQRVTIASDSTGQVIAQGNVAQGVTATANPLPDGCVYTSTMPTVTTGQAVGVQCTARGAIIAELYSGGSTITTANGVNVQPFGPSSTNWSYTSGTSPILSNTTTAVTIKTAAGASVINYIDSCEIGSTALGAVVPLALRDGAGGTVKFAVRAPTTGWLTPWTVNFQPPLKGTANTLWEVVTTTADTSGTYDVNCQGHTGS